MKNFSNFLRSLGKIGCIGFGGGSALIPVIEDEIVGRQKLDTKDNLDKDVIVASITPGALPVEIAASIGRRNFGRRGMVMGAVMMAFPGALAAVLLVTLLSRAQADMLAAIELASVGISAFIIYLLINYISGMLRSCRKESRNREYKAVFLMIVVFLMVCGKNLYKLLGLELTPILGISTIHVLLLAFFCFFYSRGKYNGKTISVMLVLGLVFLLGNGKTEFISDSPILSVAEVLMVFLSCWGVWQNIRESNWKFENKTKLILKDAGVWLVIFIVASVPAVLACIDAFSLIGRGTLSSLLSFGGGDAYLTIADGLFVESGMVTEKQYYSQIVTIVNALPGSILCKTLACIGYYFGLNITGSVFSGLLFATAGFFSSICASCGFFIVVYYLYENLVSLHAFKMIGRWIRPIIAGLLINIMLSLVNQCTASMKQFSVSAPITIAAVAGLYLADMVMMRRLQWGTIWVLCINIAVIVICFGIL